MSPIEPLKRAEAGTAQGVNQAVVRALFATPPGEVADEVVALGDGFAVVATEEVIAADPAADPDGVERLAAELEADMQTDLIAQFEAQLRRDYPVEIDAAAINRVIGADGLLQTGAARAAAPERAALRSVLSRWRRAPTRPSSPPATRRGSRRWSGPRWSPTSRRRSRRCSSWPKAGPTASCSSRSRAARCAAATRRSASSRT